MTDETKEKNELHALGGLLMLIGMLASSVFMPDLFAQLQWDKFGIIDCGMLRVVDEAGNPGVIISTSERGGKVTISGSGEDRTRVILCGHKEQHIYAGDSGGYISVQGKGS